MRPLYTPADLKGDRGPGYPGDYPYTRGIQPTGYRGRLWTMRQYAGMGDAEESNKRYRDRKSTRLNSSHIQKSRMPSSA